VYPGRYSRVYTTRVVWPPVPGKHIYQDIYPGIHHPGRLPRHVPPYVHPYIPPREATTLCTPHGIHLREATTLCTPLGIPTCYTQDIPHLLHPGYTLPVTPRVYTTCCTSRVYTTCCTSRVYPEVRRDLCAELPFFSLRLGETSAQSVPLSPCLKEE